MTKKMTTPTSNSKSKCYDAPSSKDGLFDNIKKAELQDENTCWLNTNEAAKFLRVSPNALRILVHRAQVKYFKFGRRLRFKVSDLNGLHQSREV